MPRPIRTHPIDLYKDPLTGREICAHCFDGEHQKCNSASSGCRCLHHFSQSTRRPKKDMSGQSDMSGFGTIEVGK